MATTRLMPLHTGKGRTVGQAISAMVIMTGYVDDMSTSNGVSAEYLTELHSFMNGTMVVIIAVVTFVAGIVGALIAKGVFKKHFQKAGIV